MKGQLWRRLAVVAALTAGLLSGTPSQAAENFYRLTDPSGDAHAGTSLCAVDCSGLPTPASEPSLDVRTITVDRVDADLVISYRVEDLDHVPLPAQPDDVAGYDISFEAEGVRFSIIAQRTAAHVPLEAFVVAGNYPDYSRRPVGAVYDHATDTVRVTLPLAVLDDAIDDTCGSCHIDGSTVFEHPFAMAYLLAMTPGGPTGPVYQDIVRETASKPIVPTVGGLPITYFGGGPFSGTLTFGTPSAACGDNLVPTTMSVTINVAWSKGTGHYVGPLTLEGSGCGNTGGSVLFDHTSMRGTDLQGRTLACPELGGMVVNTAFWGGSFGGECTLDGKPVHMNPAPWGQYVPTGIGTSGTGVVAGAFTISGYERTSS